MIDRLVQALQQEFTDVNLYLAPAKSYNTPSVAVRPGTPFIEVTTHGLVRETWDVLVLVNSNQPDKGVAALRKLSLRIRRAAHSVGAIWDGAADVGQFQDESNTKIALANIVRFRYTPDPLLIEDESSSSSSSSSS